ncbi:MAG: non-homologous end-joining DNA ligase [Streptosporangiaceae bacterium]
MLAVSGALPAGPEAASWAYELKWDGIRAITYVDAGSAPVRATSRRGNDVTGRYPELDTLSDLLPGHRVVLDGELVAFDERGRPSFERIQPRIHARAGCRLAAAIPVAYVVFDLLYLDGTTTTRLPYAARREALEALGLAGGAVQTSQNFGEGGAELLRVTQQQGLEGLLAKRLDAPYLPGRRSDAWRKVKHTRTQDVVICGWQPGRGRREGGVGSLLLGVYDTTGLRYAGHVGTGFTDAVLADLGGRLRELAIDASPYDEEVPREFAREARWVRPALVGEVTYTMWTGDGRLRAPSWRGLRADKDPHEVRREDEM